MTRLPRLLALSTAVPPHVIDQWAVRAHARQLFGGSRDFERLMPMYENAGVAIRHSCVSLEQCRELRGWPNRNTLYIENAVALLKSASLDCLRESGLQPEDIDTIVVVSSAGIATPSLDAVLMEKLAFRRDVERLPIFGFGCAGGVLGLARAAALARAAPDSRVLLLVVETLFPVLPKHGPVDRRRRSDGSVRGRCSRRHCLLSRQGPSIGPSGEHTWANSLDVIGWEVSPTGLKALSSRDIPTLVRTGLRPVVDDFLCKHGLVLSDIGKFVWHPGGGKVVDALEGAFALPEGGWLRHGVSCMTTATCPQRRCCSSFVKY